MNKLFKSKNKNDNWVSKIISRRKRYPLYVTLSLVVLICFAFFYFEYNEYNDYVNNNKKIQNDIDRYLRESGRIDSQIENSNSKLKDVINRKINSEEYVAFYKNVCLLLQKRDVIGSYTISKKLSEKYSNVLHLEIKVSYGDLNMLYLISKIVGEKVFFLKDIKKTQTGVKLEFYKPVS